jgi:hypothetical protein
LTDFQFAGRAGAQDLIRGHDRKLAMNARKKNRQGPLDKVSENQPPDRIAELERQVARLQKDVALLKRFSGWPLFAHKGNAPKEKKKPGPKEKISDEVLVHYRDGLVLWLERFWPWLEERLLRATTREQVSAILHAVAEEPDLRPAWQNRLLQNAAALCEFLWDERFRKTLPKATVTDALTLPWEKEKRKRAANQFPTRQIANAMAGVPDIGWRRSLDRCSAHPPKTYVALNLDMFYRDRYGIPVPEDRDLTGMSCPVPKPLQPVLAPSGDDFDKRSSRKGRKDLVSRSKN